MNCPKYVCGSEWIAGKQRGMYYHQHIYLQGSVRHLVFSVFVPFCLGVCVYCVYVCVLGCGDWR